MLNAAVAEEAGMAGAERIEGGVPCYATLYIPSQFETIDDGNNRRT